jgi:hypothetical protein
MERVGKLPKNGRYILLVSQDEYYELKAKGFLISDSIPIPKHLGVLTKNMDKDFEDLVKQEYHDSLLWKTAEEYFDVQVKRNASVLKFKNLNDFNTIKRQGKTLSPAQRKLYKQELIRRNRLLESWYRALLEIKEDGYSDEYINSVLIYALNNITSKEDIQKMIQSGRRVWRGWGLTLFSLISLKKVSSNGLTKWNNIVLDYERNLQKSFSFLEYSPQIDDYEV